MLYDNCQLVSPEGIPLAFIDKKRANWYLRNQLGVVIQEEPNMVIQLNFTPSSIANENDTFYLIPRENKCVVCGTNKDLTKHHVIPQSFRKHFPVSFKSRSSHDVLALCREHHDLYNLSEVVFRKELAERFRVPESGLSPTLADNQLRKLASAARALLNTAHKLPTWREDELLTLIIDHLDRWPEQEDLKKLVQIWPSSRVLQDQGYPTMSAYIVAQLSVNELNDFCKEWRKHFVETMDPKFLPENWSVDRDLREDFSIET